MFHPKQLTNHFQIQIFEAPVWPEFICWPNISAKGNMPIACQNVIEEGENANLIYPFLLKLEDHMDSIMSRIYYLQI